MLMDWHVASDAGSDLVLYYSKPAQQASRSRAVRASQARWWGGETAPETPCEMSFAQLELLFHIPCWRLQVRAIPF
jgi:hypothetical protein